MPQVTTELLPIDNSLRFVLYGISVLLDINLSASEIERLFAAATSQDSSAQSFEFHCSPHILVTGRTDEYEPESVWLSVSAKQFDLPQLQRLVAAAHHASFRLRP